MLPDPTAQPTLTARELASILKVSVWAVYAGCEDATPPERPRLPANVAAKARRYFGAGIPADDVVRVLEIDGLGTCPVEDIIDLGGTL